MSVARAELESPETAEAAFRLEHPRYADTAVLDELRARDFARLNRGGHVYLDYTGGGLFAESQLHEHVGLPQANVLGNPHSLNPTFPGELELHLIV
jgi:molybdenum cofactor sulfurtransferase